MVLSQTTTRLGEFEDALTRPHEPSSRCIRTPFTVKIDSIF